MLINVASVIGHFKNTFAWDCFRFCLTSIARHHAISRAVVESLGNSEIFFKRFPYLDFEGFAQPWAYNLIGNMMEKATSRSLALLQVSWGT